MAGSLASSTMTRVDSASKHILPCKVNTDYMASLVDNNVDNSMRELQTNKMRYCMHKDDIVIGLGRPMYGSSINSSRKKAYPSVIVTLASMEDPARKWIAIHNFLVKGFNDSSDYKKMYLDHMGRAGRPVGTISDTQFKKMKEQIDNMLEFYFVGVSLGLAYAHPHSGDTVASVMVGGLRTVLNGHFQVHTNDLLMFYWADEVQLFEEDGGRKDRKILMTDVAPPNLPDIDLNKIERWVQNNELESKKVGEGVTRAAQERRDFYNRGNGVYKTGPDGPSRGKVHVALIKPYIVSRYPDPATNGPQHFPMDKFRVFGKAISNAQPFEMVDIMLSRQAI